MNKPTLSLIFAAACPLSTLSAKDPIEKVTSVSNDNAEMNEAIAKARSLLPHFWQTFDAPKRGEWWLCEEAHLSSRAPFALHVLLQSHEFEIEADALGIKLLPQHHK